MSATTDFVAAQKQNRRNTVLLLAILTVLAAAVGYGARPPAACRW
jgi:heat shock protein HtpX